MNIISNTISTTYEKILLHQIHKQGAAFPGHVALVLSEGDILDNTGFLKLAPFTQWCIQLGVKRITVYISIINIDDIYKEISSEFTAKIIDKLSHVKARVNIYTRDSCQCINEHYDSPLLNISVGVGGKYELTQTTIQIMEKIQASEIQPEDITPELIESHLLFKHEPDMVIRSGGKQLTDFLIWQSAYSELYFTDVSWINFRYIDLLRAIRDYQKRKRKFGR